MKTIEDILKEKPWTAEKEKTLLAEFRAGILESYSSDAYKTIPEWRNCGIQKLEFEEDGNGKGKPTCHKIQCYCWLDEYGVIHAQVDGGFHIEFMPPEVLHHPKLCGKHLGKLVIDIFEACFQDYLDTIKKYSK